MSRANDRHFLSTQTVQLVLRLPREVRRRANAAERAVMRAGRTRLLSPGWAGSAARPNASSSRGSVLPDPDRLRRAGEKKVSGELHRSPYPRDRVSPCHPPYPVPMPASRRVHKHQRLKERQRAKLRLSDVVRAHKARPCHDCGIQYPSYVMQLDHRPGEIKRREPSKSKTPTAFLREALSCDVVCSNCHAERTWQRMRSAAAGKLASEQPGLPFAD